MKKILTLPVFCLFISFASFAQDRTSSVKELFKLMKSEEMVDKMMDNMSTAMKQQMAPKASNEDAKAKFEKFSAALNEETQKLTNRLMNEVMVDLYVKHFTDQEINDMISFYKTPTGQKLLEKTPVITGEMMTTLMQKYMPEFQENIKKRME